MHPLKLFQNRIFHSSTCAKITHLKWNDPAYKSERKKTMHRKLPLTGLFLAGVRLHDIVVEPHVGDGHAVLCERSRLVGADRRGGAERLDSLEVLHETVLAGHTLRSQGQTHLVTRVHTKSKIQEKFWGETTHFWGKQNSKGTC